MEKNIDFSIIIPVYNTDRYLSECIDSVIKQTYSSWEIILIDDGSTDLSGEICDEYEKKYNGQIRVLHKKNEGQILSRQRGLQISRGKYIVYLDSDDMLCSITLETLYEIFTKKNVDLVIYQWERITEGSELISNDKSNLFDEGYISKSDIINKFISSASLNSMCIKAGKRKIYSINELNYKAKDIRHGEDLIQSITLLDNMEKAYYLQKPLYYYRINNESVTHTFDKHSYQELDTVRPILYNYLKEKDLLTKEREELFFGFYLETIINEIENIMNIYMFNVDFVKMCEDIATYSLVEQGKAFYRNGLSIRLDKKLGLFLFYQKKWSLLQFYIRMILILKRFKHFIMLNKNSHK